ncbi:MAG: aldehyde dehydrogenase family protein [Bacteriovoracaceae bacterium]|nr:aldehyde dehydrogenase family protein [Bacteriovoracaceae bacterium]
MHMVLKGDYFDGQWHSPSTAPNENIIKKSPADLSKTLWEAKVWHAHTDAVVDSAIKGFETWRKLSFEERSVYIRRYQEAVKKRGDAIAEALAWEVGKPLWEAKTEASALVSKVDVTLGDSLKRIEKRTIKEVMPKIDGHTILKPIGPAFIIGPFNFPCHLANGQILAALTAGNSIIFKPSEKTIGSAQLMMEALVEADFPKGVINFINGTGLTAGKLTSDSRIRAVFFTGSRAVGKMILKNTHQDLKKMVALELGGKNSTIVHHDAHIPHALPELLRACFLTSGQRCTSTSMILVHRKIANQFIDEFKKVTQRIRVDHPVLAESPAFMGPVIDAQAEKLYLDFCAQGLKEGAEVLVEPKKLEMKWDGHYVSPSLHYLERVDLKGKFVQEEIFGPNACFMPYDDIDQAIAIANCTEYGLAASVFTRDQSLFEHCLRDIDAGLINLNRSTVGATARLPFGGVKDSGNFRPAAVSMIDHCVHTVAALETTDDTSSHLKDVVGLKE